MTAHFTEYSTMPVAGQEADKKDGDKHIIVTNHPVLVDIGLGTFTTGTLMAWWNEPSDESPDLLNRFFFPGKDQDNYPSFLFEGPLNFSAWRNPDRDYVNYTDATATWNFSNTESDGSRRNYTFSDLDFIAFNNKEAERQTNDASPPQLVLTSGNIDQKICNIITMNDYINMFHDFDPDETQSSWTGTPRARSEYIRDIKTCKNGSGLFWTPTISYSPSNGVDTGDTIQITPTFHLYLFDEVKPSKNMRKLAMRDFVIIDNPKDAIDTVYENRTKIDGTYNQVDPGNTPQARVAAPLDVTYNQYTGKWESGTRQIIARLMTDIPAAQNIALTSPDAGTQYGLEVSDILNKDNPNYEHAQIGKAMPIMMQNGNPLQWSPMYEQAEDLPRVNTNKKLVDVVNPAGRAWTSGTMVILNKIDGVWIPSDFGVQEGEGGAATSNFDGVWDFTYLLSNARYHMSQNNAGLSFHYDDYERLYYKSYYGTAGDNPQQNVTDFDVLANGEEGYLQITSWDFMGPNLGGNCDGNNIGGTIFDINVNGEPIGANADGKRASTKVSAPFFGCTFPGGYVGDSIYNAYNTPNGHAVLNTFVPYLDSPFFNQVGSDKIVFENTLLNNNNSDSAGATTLGMFAKNSSNLVHFPADMAVNASPSGENGRPISDIRHIYALIKPDTAAVSNAAIYFNKDSDGKPFRYAWMYKGTNPWDSAWDLAPKNKNIIEFRPLTRDVFNCLEAQNLTEYSGLTPGANERGLYGRKAQEVLIKKGDPPMSPVILNRTTSGSITQLSRSVIPNYPHESDGSTNKTRLAYGPQDMTPEVGASYYIKSDRYSPAPYPIDGYGTTGKPGGAAIGIITAICTTTAPSKIVFNTQTYIGVQTREPNKDPAHGGNQRPQDFGCTTLHARIFSAWPRELTVYDSRFFSVFHFNYGAGIINFDSDWYLDGVKQNGTPPSNASYSYPDGWYVVSRKITEVDIRVPTWRTPTTETAPAAPAAGVNDNDEIPDGQFMFNNSAVRSVDDWLIPEDLTTGGIRRGKLLPLSSADKYKGFKYKKKTIKPGAAGVTISSYPVPTTPPSTPVTNDGTKHVMIINGGSGYTSKDRFTIRGATGTGTVLIPRLSADKIIGFTFATVTDAEAYNSGDTLTGYDYLHTDFLDYNAPLDGSVKPSAQIVAIDAAGQDLEAYFVCGVVGDSPLLRDLGPDEITEGAERLTASPSASDNYITQPILDDLTETSIGTEGKSSDNKFDIYFFFHNDVSHHSYDDSLYSNFFQSRVRVEILQE